MADSRNKPSVTNEVISSILGAVPWALGAGGLGALGGYFFTGGDKDEDPKARMQRRLKNALIMGAMGAGIGGGGKMAYDLIGDDKASLSEEMGSSLGKAGDMALDAIGSDYFRYGGSLAAGGAGGYIGYKQGVKGLDEAMSTIKSLDPMIKSEADVLAKIKSLGGDPKVYAGTFAGNEAKALKAIKAISNPKLFKGLRAGGSAGASMAGTMILSLLAGNAGAEEAEARRRGD